MSKFPDISKLASKINVDSIVKQVREVVNPDVIIPEGLDGNPLVAKMKVLHDAIERVNDLQKQQSDSIKEIKSVVGMLYEDVKAFNAETKNVEGVTDANSKGDLPSQAEDTAVEQAPTSDDAAKNVADDAPKGAETNDDKTS